MAWERLSIDNPKRPVAVGRVVWPSRVVAQDHHHRRTEGLESLTDDEILSRRTYWATVLRARIPIPSRLGGDAGTDIGESPRKARASPFLPSVGLTLAFCLVPAAFRFAAKWPQIIVPSLLLFLAAMLMLELRQRVIRRLRNTLEHDECPVCGFDCSGANNPRHPCPECGYACPLIPPPIPR